MPEAGTPVGADLLSRVRREIDARLRELRPLVAEYERLLSAGASRRAAAAGPARPARRQGRAAAAPAERPRARRGAAEQAIIAALEHGSHTVAELGVVTAMSGAIIRDNLRRLLKAGTVTRARRDGKAAYALSRPPGG